MEKQKREPSDPNKDFYMDYIDSILSSYSDDVKNSITSGDKKFEDFKRKFNESFPDSNPEYRVTAETLIELLFDVPLRLYYIGQNPAVFVELFGFLERYTIRDVPSFLGKDRSSVEIIETLIERKTLPELSDVLLKKGIWSEEDIKFVQKLTRIRNGIAHKNAMLLSKQLGNGNHIYLGDAENLVFKTDCTDYIIKTIELMVKLSLKKRAITEEKL